MVVSTSTRLRQSLFDSIAFVARRTRKGQSEPGFWPHSGLNFYYPFPTLRTCTTMSLVGKLDFHKLVLRPNLTTYPFEREVVAVGGTIIHPGCQSLKLVNAWKRVYSELAEPASCLNHADSARLSRWTTESVSARISE